MKILETLFWLAVWAGIHLIPVIFMLCVYGLAMEEFKRWWKK